MDDENSTSDAQVSTTAASSSWISDYFLGDLILNLVEATEFIVSGPLILISLPTTIITAVIFIRSPLGTTKTTRVYYTTIAICNFCSTVIRDIVIDYPWYVLPFVTLNVVNWDPEFTSTWSCRTLDYLLFVFEMMTNNVYLALTLERCIALFFPLHAVTFVSQRKALGGVIVIVVGSLLISSATLAGASQLYYSPDNSYVSCTTNYFSTGFVSQLALAMMFLSWIVPTGLTSLLNVAVLCKLVQNRDSAKKFGTQQSSTKSAEATVTLLVITGVHLLIYVPMGAFHTTPLFMSMAGLKVPSAISILAVAGYPWLPTTHVANFIVYYVRVKGFKQNIIRTIKCQPALKQIEKGA